MNVDHEVKIIKKDEEIIRTALGINERGELIVQDAEGRKEHIFPVRYPFVVFMGMYRRALVCLMIK